MVSEANHDHEWLLARERGEDVSHVPAHTRATYDLLQARLGDLPDEAPGLAWRHRVLAALDEPMPIARPPARSRKWMVAAGGLAAAALALVLVVRHDPGALEPGYSTEVQPNAHAHRGGAVAVDDTLVIHAQASASAELRVYDEDGSVLARCGDGGGAHCKIDRDGDNRRLTLDLVLTSPGAVRSVLYTGGTMPAARDLNADQDAALRSHIATFSRDAIQVE
jgi:hypothetical protein